jgi:hypothetical protein
MDAFLGNLQEAIFKMNPDTTQVLRLQSGNWFLFMTEFLQCWQSSILWN